MTAPAAAPTSGPVAPAVAPRAAAQMPADRFAFGTMLDSLPGASAKASPPAAEEQAPPSNESPQDESSRGQAPHRSALNDSTLFASLPFALRVGSMMDERAQTKDNSPSPTSPALKGPKSADAGVSPSAGAKAPSVGRLIGERAFHLAASTTRFMPQVDLKGESALAASFGRDQAVAAKSLPVAISPPANAMVSAPAAPRAPAAPSNRGSLTRAAVHEAARSGQKPEGSAPPPVIRAANSTSPPAPTESSAKTADGLPPDPTSFGPPPTAQTSPFGAQLSAPFVVNTSFQPDAPPTNAANADAAPRANALGPGSASSTPPVREIDVDLSPGGLENVSMTMRLNGDKLSVVIRAASSQTLGSIEGARDAITDRMAAIGQPLDSIVVKQMGVSADGNANGNGSSADGGSSGGEQRSAHGNGERNGSNDAGMSRRGAGRDRSF
jgi:Flagellar hook-length control protein FliK